MKEINQQDSHQPDYTLIVLVALIGFIGLAFLSSASSAVAYKNFQDSFYYLKHQLLSGLLPGIFLFVIAYFFDLKKIEKLAPILFGIGIFLLLAIFIPGVGMSHGEAQRWINLRIFSFQPIEIFKLFFIIFLASFFAKRENKINNFYITILPFILITAVSATLIILQPNLSAVIIILFIAFSLYLVAGGKFLPILVMIILGLVAIIVFIKIEPYRLERFNSFLHPEVDTQDSSYQLQQALIAIGSGGVFGRGLGYSGQKFFYLPEVYGDSIFAIVAEEGGFIISVFIILLFLLLVSRGLKIAKDSEDNFSKFLAVGICAWLGIQVFINIGAMLRLIPATGVPLPLISYGGSAMAIVLAALGLLVNISKRTK